MLCNDAHKDYKEKMRNNNKKKCIKKLCLKQEK